MSVMRCQTRTTLVHVGVIVWAMMAMMAGLTGSLRADDSQAASPEQMKPYTLKLTDAGIELHFVPIPGGTFTMGSPESEADRGAEEGPAVQVSVEPMWMMSCEVTWDQYRAFMARYKEFPQEQTFTPPGSLVAADAVTYPTPLYDASHTFRKGQDGKLPAVCMTPFAAGQFSRWISLQTGQFHRLPTEAEWEYACRAGTTTPWSTGPDVASLDQAAWYFDNSLNPALNEESPRPVGQKKPNAHGLFDMHGNVAEIVLDHHVTDHYTKLAALPAPVPAFDAIAWPAEEYPHVIRGGSFLHDPADLRSARRLHTAAAFKKQDPQIPQSIWWFTDALHVGFRIVRPFTAPPPEIQKKFWAPHSDEIEMILEIQRTEAR
jgi:formylglycine-generating enzyme required for sulfatase activity